MFLSSNERKKEDLKYKKEYRIRDEGETSSLPIVVMQERMLPG
jgi:hypothetical protein